MTEIDRIIAYLESHHGDALALLTRGEEKPDLPLQDACDMVYSLALIDRTNLITRAGAEAFAKHANRWRMAGGFNTPSGEASAIVHLTAYTLGTLRLLENAGHPVDPLLINRDSAALDELVDASGKPRWPAHFSHHGWRVSHWVGGAPSIIMNLWKLSPDRARSFNAPEAATVLQAADSLVAPQTGLLKCYRSDLLQSVFRTLYRLRHDPDAGDVGGIVHLHWVNYASGRLPYKAADKLFDRALKIYWRKPFIENVPYCLDFDVVQIVRTAASGGQLDDAVKQRARLFIDDIDAFFETQLNADYALHKLPGALATQHEAALILGDKTVGRLGVAPVDIIEKAGWI